MKRLVVVLVVLFVVILVSEIAYLFYTKSLPQLGATLDTKEQVLAPAEDNVASQTPTNTDSNIFSIVINGEELLEEAVVKITIEGKLTLFDVNDAYVEMGLLTKNSTDPIRTKFPVSELSHTKLYKLENSQKTPINLDNIATNDTIRIVYEINLLSSKYESIEIVKTN